MKIYRSFSLKETKKIGENLAKIFAASRAGSHTRPRVKGGRRKNALVFALKGELGAGKTTFVQGFFRGLGLMKRATSPTFVLMRRHALRNKKFQNVFHVDAYRLRSSKHLKALGLKEIFNEPTNIVLVEWADKVKKILPKETVWLQFGHGTRENERRITAQH